MAKKTLTLYLAKPDVERFEDVLSDAARQRLGPPTEVIEAPDFGDGGRLYVFVGQNAAPRWLTDLRREFHIARRIETRSACAVLVFRASGRMFVSTFAHGWSYVNEENVEGEFGIRAALNELNELKLKRLERANLGDALRGVSLSPFQREFSSFGLDDALDLVRKISGSANEDASADAVTGARSLKVSGDFDISDLPAIAAEALEFFGSDAYRDTTFRVIDLVAPIGDRRLIDTLDQIALQSIRAQREEFELGLPASYEDEGVAYRFQGPRLLGRYANLLMRNYASAMGDRLAELTIEDLKRHKVVAVYEDDARPPQKWSIRFGLVGSIVHEVGRYAINEGEWYRIDQTFKDSIEETFRGLVMPWEQEPPPFTKIYDVDGNGRYQTEASYNADMARANGYVLLDTELIEIEGVQRSSFEACDLLDIDRKRIIHVKKNSRRSSVLSHFFKQGSNSAQNLSKFPNVWRSLEGEVRRISGNQVAQRLRDAIDDGRKWAVEFIIADSPRRNGEFNIPFFSKITLRDEVSNLKVACTRFQRHRVRCFDGTGGGSWRDGSLHGSSSLRRCA